MSCYHPISMVVRGVQPNGKLWLEILKNSDLFKDLPRIEVPCGRCIGCRLDHAKMWADRCMLELQDHDESYFVTLTYDDEHVKLVDGVYATLDKRDLQNFFKRLRKSGQKVRYFACGEYGDKTFRPHYHAIIFGLHLFDRKFFRRAPQGYSYWISPYLEKVWGNGQILITDVTYETCSYVARYVIKKVNADLKQLYSDLCIDPEFIIMSRKPGIARHYYDTNKGKIFDSDYITVATSRRGLKFKPPRYFQKLLELDDPEKFYELKGDRMMASDIISAARASLMSYSPSEERCILERVKQKQVKILERSMI